MLHNSHNQNQLEQHKEAASHGRTFDELVAQARSVQLYDGPDGGELPEVIKQRLTSFLMHAMEQAGGVPQRYAVACLVSPLPPGAVLGEPREIVEYDYDYDLGCEQILHLENYRYFDSKQMIELDVVRRGNALRNVTGPELSWPTEIVNLFRNRTGEVIGNYHTYQRFQVVLFESERARLGG